LALIDAPEELKGRLASPPVAKLMMDKTVYLPIHKRVPAQLVNGLAEQVVFYGGSFGVQKMNQKICCLIFLYERSN
jgi:ribosomal protein L13